MKGLRREIQTLHNKIVNPRRNLKVITFIMEKHAHRVVDCKAPKKPKKKDQENVLNIENDYLCAMLSQWNIIENPR